MAKRIAHFVVTGDAMTQAARNLLLDDEPGRAYRLLADGLIGDGHLKVVLQVLQGTHDIAGDSRVGLDVAPAADTEELRRFKREFNYIYAGRIQIRLERGRTWVQPVAWVVRLGPEDARWARKQGHGTGSRAWHQARPRYYCSDNGTAHSLELPGEGTVWVLWEPCGELPQWVKPPLSLQDALDQALAAGRTLEQRPSKADLELEAMLAREEQKEKRAKARTEKGIADNEERREREHAAEIQRIGDEVRRQAGDDTFAMKLSDGRVLTVPRAPFDRWALRTVLGAELPEWKRVAPSGLKMGGDNPDHTDWVLGAGLSLGEAYSDIVNDAAWERAFRVQEEARAGLKGGKYAGIRRAMEMLSDTVHPAATVVDAGERIGTVGVDIAVFPDSEASRVHQLGDSVGVIVQKAGKLAHFAIVTKGRGITVMRHPHACELFEAGVRVKLNPKSGRIVILDSSDE